MTDRDVSELYIACRHWLDVLDEMNIGAFTVAMDHSVGSMNFSAQALMGLREEEVTGKDCRDIFCGVPCTVSCIVNSHLDEETGVSEVEFIDEKDRRNTITRIATPIYDPKQNLIGCLTILQDHSPIVDLINRVQYEERSLKIILDNLDVGIFTVNRGGLITFFNTAAEEISGYRRDQVLGQPCSTIFEGVSAPDVCLLKESIADGKSRASHMGKMITIEGGSVPVRANYMALRNEKGSIIGGIATFHDLTLVHRLNQAIRNQYTFHDMIGKSPAMQQMFETVEVIAETDATVLIEGATGTGKDLLAKVIHSAGKRSKQPFIKINCAAIPENMLESELFGYARGAFTGADRDRPGRFQLAHGGTIFLDEIGDVPMALQAKLLRVLEDREFYPLGSRNTVKVDVRIVSATNRGLNQMVAGGLFREDLYYRLNVMQIVLPELRERKEDLPLLISHIVRKLRAAKDKPPPTISEAAMEILLNWDYPGNVRELENILEHALIICRGGTILPEHLPMAIRQWPANPSRATPEKTSPHPKEEDEAGMIRRLLRENNGHRGKTAVVLGIDRSTLWRKMKKLGVD